MKTNLINTEVTTIGLDNIMNNVLFKVSLFGKATDLKYLFENRNREDSVLPFLDLLGEDYIIINRAMIIIKTNKTLELKLKDLKFDHVAKIVPRTKYFAKLLKQTKDLFESHLYNQDYNFEFYLATPEQWQNAILAKQLSDSLRLNDNKYLVSYISILDTLNKNHQESQVK